MTTYFFRIDLKARSEWEAQCRDLQKEVSQLNEKLRATK